MWTFDDINTDWLAGGRLAVPPNEVVDSFNRVERILGHDWIEASRLRSGLKIRGTLPTLGVVTTGQMLASLDGVNGDAAKLILKLKNGDESAFAELTALHLVRSGTPTAMIELAPVVKIEAHDREPDFRVCLAGQPSVYVEVTKPDVADAQVRARSILNRLAALVLPIKRSFSLEVFLRREPTDGEVDVLSERVPHFCRMEGNRSTDIPGLAILSLNRSAPGQVALLEHEGEPDTPRLGCARVMRGPGEPHRHIAVRMPYSDDRAELFLKRKAKQLPDDSPGMIMVEMSGASGGMKAWEPLLRRRFQPTIHTRVSAVCLFTSGHEASPPGEAWIPETKLLLNQYARLPLPEWIIAGLRMHGPTV